MTHKCRTGNHTWFFKEDADKCCNPVWKRELIIGDNGLRECNRIIVGQLPGGQSYGFAWKKVGGSFCEV